MWTAAARDVSSRSPPPTTHERHLSIADSVVSTTAEEIRERYRLSARDDSTLASSFRPPLGPPSSAQHGIRPHARRDSIFSFNTTWTADESFMDSTGMISDFPRPPTAFPGARFAPALPSSLGHVLPSQWTREPEPTSARSAAPSSASRYESNVPTPYAEASFEYQHSPGLGPQPSAFSSSTHLPAPTPPATQSSHPQPEPPLPLPQPRTTLSTPAPTPHRPHTAPSTLTVRTDAAQYRYLDPNSNAPIEIISGPSPNPSPTSPNAPKPKGLSPTGSSHAPTSRLSPSHLSPTSLLLSPSPSADTNPTSPSSHYLVPSPSRSPGDKVPGFPVAPPSPATAAFLRQPVVAPSTHASHEELLDPGFIRTLMSGIEGGRDGLDLSLSGEEDVMDSPFGDRHAASSYEFEAEDDEGQEGEEEGEQEQEVEESQPPTPAWFRRAPPAASLPSSPRSSFSFSVRSGVGRGLEEEGSVPAVPPLPALYRTEASGSGSRAPGSGSPLASGGSGSGSGSLRSAQTQTQVQAQTPPHSQAQTPASNVTSFGTLRPDQYTRRRQSIESSRTRRTGKDTVASTGSGMSTLTAGSTRSGSALSGISERSGSGETGVVQHAALVRTASVAEMSPAVYTSASGVRSPTGSGVRSPVSSVTSPVGEAYAGGVGTGDERWIGSPGAHARTTSADLERLVRNRKSLQQLQFISATHPDRRRLREEVVEEGDDLVYVSGEGVRERYGRESEYAGRDSQYVGRESRYGGGRESGYLDPRDSRYGGRDSQYINGRESQYAGGILSQYGVGAELGAWAEPPSPNEMTPALRDSVYDGTSPTTASARGVDTLGSRRADTLSTMRGMGTMSTLTTVPTGGSFPKDIRPSPSTAPGTVGHGSPPGTAGFPPSPASGGFPSTPGAGVQTFSALGGPPDESKRAKRVSATSFVSSVFSKFSGHSRQSSHHASAGHTAGTRTFAFTWRNGGAEAAPPLPTPSPHVARMWEAYNKSAPSAAHSGSGTESTRMSSVVRREGNMELPALARRAETLNEMLELGKLPHRSKSTIGPSTPRVADVPVGVDQEGNDDYLAGGYTDEKALRRNRSLRSVFTTISDRSRRFMGGGLPNNGSASLRSSLVDIPGQENMRFNRLPEEMREQVQGPKVRWGEGTGVPPVRSPRPVASRKRLWTFVTIAVLAIVAIIGVSVGLTQSLGKRKPDAGGFTCSAVNRTGRLCDLDSSCTCTSSLAGQCNPLAGAIVSLVDPVNTFFNPSPAFTSASVALAIWELQGSPLPGANCANQADLVDVGPALSFTETGTLAANRTEFARSALLWTLVMSMDTNGTARMQEFIQGLNFSLLDGPTASTIAGEFLFGAAGYQVDFGNLTVSQPAVTWVGAGKPSDAQVALVGGDVRKALDRVYTFAAASSAQRSTALARYWTSVLQFPASELSTFRSVASASPVLLPFDATSSAVQQLFSNVNQSFPPSAACYPNLSADQLSAINTMETQAFGLSAITSAPTALDASCFQSRPVYGVLDIARLRTPFTSQVQNAPRQAAQIAAAAVSRVSVRLGRDLAGLPSTSISSANVTGANDARTFGTLGNMDHVLLTYLQSFPSIQAAGALVEYVLGASDARAPPPSNTSALFNLTASLAELPMLEVAFFGTVGPDDLSLAVADFASTDGELFFGSTDADTFRTWAVQRAGSVVWGDGAMAQQVVREGATKDQTFEEVWKGGSTLLSNAATTGTKTSRSDVQRIVDAFKTIGYLGS